MAMTDEEIEKVADVVCKRLEMVVIPKPLGVSELADYLGVKPAWVYGNKNLPHFWAGKHKLFMVRDVLKSLGLEIQTEP